MIRAQIASGMSAERLAFVVRSARAPRNCSEPETKRFIVKTPTYTGPASNASFGEGAIVITGQGLSSRNAIGQAESWFDPSQPVAVEFKSADGEIIKKEGVLPFQHSMVANGKEYRFNLTEGDKSFIKVTFDSCDYP
jgi:hypothetical protein